MGSVFFISVFQQQLLGHTSVRCGSVTLHVVLRFRKSSL
jgi:hypothetical protein